MEIEELVSVSDSESWEALSKYFIWSPEQVKSYANPAAFIWIGRVYKLQTPHVICRQAVGGPPTHYRHPDELEIEPNLPVLEDAEYKRLRNAILKQVNA